MFSKRGSRRLSEMSTDVPGKAQGSNLIKSVPHYLLSRGEKLGCDHRSYRDTISGSGHQSMVYLIPPHNVLACSVWLVALKAGFACLVAHKKGFVCVLALKFGLALMTSLSRSHLRCNCY